MSKRILIPELVGKRIEGAAVWNDHESGLSVELYLEGGQTLSIEAKRTLFVNILDGDQADETYARTITETEPF